MKRDATRVPINNSYNKLLIIPNTNSLMHYVIDARLANVTTALPGNLIALLYRETADETARNTINPSPC